MKQDFLKMGILIGSVIGVSLLGLLALTPNRSLQHVFTNPATNIGTYQLSLSSTAATALSIPDVANIRQTSISVINVGAYMIGITTSATTTADNGYILTTTSAAAHSCTINTTDQLYGRIIALGAGTAAACKVNIMVTNYD